MDSAIIVACISGAVALITVIINVLSNNRVQKELAKQKRDDDQAEALELCLRSNWYILHGLQQIKNEETGEPLINGESHALQKEIEEFQQKKVRESL